MAKASKSTMSKKKVKKEKVDQETFDKMIEQKAYEIYEERGKVDGNDLDHWLEAERIVKEKVDIKGKRKAKAKKKTE